MQVCMQLSGFSNCNFGQLQAIAPRWSRHPHPGPRIGAALCCFGPPQGGRVARTPLVAPLVLCSGGRVARTPTLAVVLAQVVASLAPLSVACSCCVLDSEVVASFAPLSGAWVVASLAPPGSACLVVRCVFGLVASLAPPLLALCARVVASVAPPFLSLVPWRLAVWVVASPAPPPLIALTRCCSFRHRLLGS